MQKKRIPSKSHHLPPSQILKLDLFIRNLELSLQVRIRPVQQALGLFFARPPSEKHSADPASRLQVFRRQNPKIVRKIDKSAEIRAGCKKISTWCARIDGRRTGVEDSLEEGSWGGFSGHERRSAVDAWGFRTGAFLSMFVSGWRKGWKRWSREKGNVCKVERKEEGLSWANDVSTLPLASSMHGLSSLPVQKFEPGEKMLIYR